MDTKRAMLRFISLMLCLMLVLSGVGVRTLAEGTALPQAQETQDSADDGEDGTEGNVTDGEVADGDETDGESTDGDGTDGEGADGEGADGDGTEGGETDGEGSEGVGTDGDGTDGNVTDGEGTDGEGTDGEGTDGEGTDGEGTDGDGTDGDGAEGDGTEGNGTDGEGTEGDGTDDDGTDGEGTDGSITDGEGADGDGTEGEGTDGEGAEGEGTEGDGIGGDGIEGDGDDGNGTDGEGTEGDDTDGDGTDGEETDGDGVDGEGADEEDGEEPEPEIIVASGPISESLAPIGGADNDALFEQYIRRNLPGLGGGVKLRSASPSAVSQLNENTQKLCNALLPKLVVVADGVNPENENGGDISTVFEITAESMELDGYHFKASDLGLETLVVQNQETGKYSFTSEAQTAVMAQFNFEFDLAIKALLADCPYTLYWYDKTSNQTTIGYSFTGQIYTSNGVCADDYTWIGLKLICFSLVASQNYRGTNIYSVNPIHGQRVQNARNTITTILNTHASEGDYTKLDNYKTEICNLVEYNHNAANDNNNVAYGDPWQLVFVFDRDSTTNVVCEGYSKAFKYLCDRSNFTGGTKCITVTGTMAKNDEAGGGHMWNIVYMPDDRYYLVDITNCDGNAIGSPDKLFLKGWTQHSDDEADTYTFTCGIDLVHYTYDGYLSEIHPADWLAISDTDYENKTYYSINISSLENGTVTPSREKAAANDPVTLTVQAAEGYELVAESFKVTGPDGEVTLTPNADGTYGFTMPAGNVTVNAAFAMPVPAFANHSVVLTGQIGVDFYMNLPNGVSAYPGSYMSFAGNNGKINATDNAPQGPDADGQYKYTCYVSSIQMAEKITPTFHYTQGGQEFTIEGKAYSAEDYIKWAKDNLSDTNLTIVKALADYGYYAQQYLSVQNGWTIGTDYAAMTTHFTEPSGFNRETILAGAAESAFTATENSQTVAQSGYRLNLGSTIGLDVRMLPAEGTEITSVTLDGAAAAVTVSGQYSVVTKSGIMASGLADEYIIVAGDCTIHVSAMSYVYEMLGRDNSSAAFKNLLCALYEYAKACK